MFTNVDAKRVTTAVALAALTAAVLAGCGTSASSIPNGGANDPGASAPALRGTGVQIQIAGGQPASASGTRPQTLTAPSIRPAPAPNGGDRAASSR